MPKSMTGYGRAASQEEHWTLSWEIRSLNNRYLDLKWKIPGNLTAHQKTWENEVRALANRGGVELFLGLKITSPALQSLNLDTAQAEAMLQELSRLASHMDIPFTPDINRLLNIPSLWRETGGVDNEHLANSLTHTLRQALADWDSARLQEGQALVRDLRARFAALNDLLSDIREEAASNVQERFATLQLRLEKLLEASALNPDSERMLQELAFLADRVDVSEELTRLGVHLERIEKMFAEDGPVGRKLDFMVQECFREINTCGNKSQNSNLSQLTVAFKAELEKCREQIQNLE